MTRTVIRATIAATMLAGATIAAAATERWVPAWGSAQLAVEGKEAEQIAGRGPVTIRQVVRLSAAGTAIRVRLSNVFGTAPLVVDAARAGTRALTFGGSRTVTIPAGAELYSDPLAMRVAAGSDVTISLALHDRPARATGHPGARATTYVADGDQSAAATMAGVKTIGGWWQIADVEVSGGAATGTIVAIGDSITDGYGIRPDSNTRWPDILAARLRADPHTRALAVVNAGIGGNRVLLDGLGPNLLARFDRDVIARPNVTHAILLEGVNDLGVLTRDAPVDAATHAQIVAAITGAYRQMAARAHAHGIALIGGTITPYVGSDYYHPGPASEADRQAINRFVRTSGVFDGVVDFDAVLRDPAHPDRLDPAYDSGDHLHPSEAGYAAMGNAVPLALFASAAKPAGPTIALTFDDLPAHGPLPNGTTRVAIAETIATSLRKAGAPSVYGFVNGGRDAENGQSAAVLAAWRRAGFPLGNHGWTHADLATLDGPGVADQIARGEPMLARTMAGQDWRWFRYPFLSEGRTAEQVAAIRAQLATRGYRIAPVTMSFGDYAWNEPYARCLAKRDTKAIARLERDYLAAAAFDATRARTLSKALYGRDIPYVLLMHAGAFDARMLPRLLALYRRMGFGFGSLPDAVADPFYANACDLSLSGPTATLESAARAAGIAIPPPPAGAALPGMSICA